MNITFKSGRKDVRSSEVMEELDRYKTTGGRIFRKIPLFLPWRWDGDHSVACVTLETQQADSVLEILLSDFKDEWDFLTIDGVSAKFREFFIGNFGVFPGQKVFTVEGDLYIFYALWWPWGNDKQVSLRLGLFSKNYSKGESSEEDDMIEQKLREWFAI